MLACCETNHDGKIDYVGFTDRFHEPAKEIGFNLAVLLTNLSEHMPNEPRLARFLETASSVLNYFHPFLGRIEILGGSKRIERVYFEIKESNIEQWEKPQIKVTHPFVLPLIVRYFFSLDMFFSSWALSFIVILPFIHSHFMYHSF